MDTRVPQLWNTNLRTRLGCAIAALVCPTIFAQPIPGNHGPRIIAAPGDAASPVLRPASAPDASSPGLVTTPVIPIPHLPLRGWARAVEPRSVACRAA